LSRDASITLAWGDGDYHFRLGWGELAKLQEAVDAGPFVVGDRLRDQSCRIELISETIRWGLIGGGKSPEQALRLVRLYVEGIPPGENRLVALAIILAGCYGAPEEQIEKKSAAPSRARRSTTSRTANSGSERSTD
jgi:hypothetical protein